MLVTSADKTCSNQILRSPKYLAFWFDSRHKALATHALNRAYSTSHSSKLYHIQSKIKANIKLRKINLAQVMNHSRASQGVTLFFFGEPSSKGSNMSVLTRLPTPSPPPICSSPSALKLSSEPPSRVEGRRRRMGRGGRLRLSHC